MVPWRLSVVDWISVSAFWPLSREREPRRMWKVGDSLARARTVSRPMPLLAPVWGVFISHHQVQWSDLYLEL